MRMNRMAGAGESKAACDRRTAPLSPEGRVEIVKTDTVDTERADGVTAATATDRILETAGIIERVCCMDRQ